MDDTTLGGYQQVHGRPPAFGAADGQAYSVATFTDDTDGRFGAALLFVRWGEGEQRPVGHLETEYLPFGGTADPDVPPLLALPLAQVKAHLDALVEQARARV